MAIDYTKHGNPNGQVASATPGATYLDIETGTIYYADPVFGGWTPTNASGVGTGLFGELTIVENSAAVSITAVNTWTQISTGWAAGDDLLGFALNTSLGNFTTPITSKRFLATLCSMSLSVTTTGTFVFGIFKNGNLLTGHEAVVRQAVPPVTIQVVCQGIDTCATGDVFDVRVQCTTASGGGFTYPQAITITDANFNIFTIG